MLKKYKAKSHVSLSVFLKNGKSTRVVFSPLTGGGSIFYTKDEELQEALENHVKYGHLFKLEKVVQKQPAVAESKKTEDNGEQQNAVKTARIVRHEVACNDDAKDYLVEKFGISRTKLRSRAQIDEAAAAHNVQFVWAQK